MRRRRQFLAMIVPLACLAAWGVSRVGFARVDDDTGPKERASDARTEWRNNQGAKTWATAIEPKPLSREVRGGLQWLVEHQLPGGGWGEGEVSMRMPGNVGYDTPNVADTCIASLALIRSGSTPSQGPYRRPIFQGVGYVCTQVEESDPQSLSVTSVNGTRVQMKLGPNIDTYMASLLLAEVKGRMPTEASERVVGRALDKVIGKIERHQIQDGAVEGAGWAPILAQAMSGKGLNRARQAGAQVSDLALAQAEDAARKGYQALSGQMPDITTSSYAALSPTTVTEFARRRAKKASPRPRSADEVSSTSLARDADEGNVGRRSLLGGASPALPSSASGGAAKDREGTGQRSVLGGARPVAASSGGSGAARDGESVDRPTEPRAASPVPRSFRAKRKTMMARAAGDTPLAPMPRMAIMGGRVGVELYSRAACIGVLQDSVNTSKAEVPRLRERAAYSQDPRERAEAEKKLAWIADTEKIQQAAQAAVVERLGDQSFLAGFGTNGGEEFLSYMTVAESLVVKGGDTWKSWDSRMTQSLDRVQNGDGSWSGSHCITGRTFCTSTALLTLMADRTPVPVQVKGEVPASYRK